MKNTPSLSKQCQVCGETFFKKQTRSKKSWEEARFCSNKCQWSVASPKGRQIDRTGIVPWNKGIKYDEALKKRLDVSGLEIGRGYFKGKNLLQLTGEKNGNWKPKTIRSCKFCNKEMQLAPYEVKDDKKFCSAVCYSTWHRGRNSPVFKERNFKGKFRTRLMQLAQYSEWHAAVMKRDGYACVLCKAGRNLEVDHIVPLVQILDKHGIKKIEDTYDCAELWDTQNGRTLCRTCHRTTDTYGNRKKKIK